MTKSWLNYINLSDNYERKARFLPALLTIFLLLPLTYSIGVPILGWVTTLLGSTSLASVIAVGFSHLASAFGNRFQEHLWPRWPHDAPTNLWLHPDNCVRSAQQKKQWHKAIKNITQLDIQSYKATGNSTELEALINDAVAQLRNRLWQSEFADRLKIHNCDYGFARNLTGMRPIWISFALISAAICWFEYFFSGADLLWPIISSVVAIIAIILAFLVLPDYVRIKAHHYAETFLSAVLQLDKSIHA